MISHQNPLDWRKEPAHSQIMKKLPIGIQTFSEIIQNNYCYVDKTKIVSDLIGSGKLFFLSRPRRFGKSLFLDTLKEAFEGNQDLFKGLYLENNWDWSIKYPVIRIDFVTGVLKTNNELDLRIGEILREHANNVSIQLKSDTISGKFRELILELEKKYSQKVVILIDEYDKPILDNITESERAKEMRDGLRNFYSVIKGADAHIEFVFITGVSKFSKVNLFSGLNNLEDITLDNNFATICGYTENELSNFGEWLEGVDREELKVWYNGYNFLGESVYNPFDILLYLKNKKYKAYWFETGNPSFLIDLIKERSFNPLEIEHIELTEEELSEFDVDYIKLELLLFQTGYLTIKDVKALPGTNVYSFQYPNREVRTSLTSRILQYLNSSNLTESTKIRTGLYDILLSGDLKQLKDLFFRFFASIPHDWYRKNTIANYEGYYTSIFYCYFTAIGLDVRAEDPTNHGQIDMTVILEDKVYVFEFKVLELTEAVSALEQIKKNLYYEKYLGELGMGFQGKKQKVFLIGVEFSKEDRNITNFEWEQV